MQRRGFLQHGLATLGAVASLPRPAQAAASTPARLAAAWDDGTQARHWVGILEAASAHAALRVLHRIEVPSRAHGLLVEDNGAVLAVARRPGDWMLRWMPGSTGKPQWCWSAQDRRFCGHTVHSASHVLSTEVDLENNQGLVVQRDLRSLETVAEWPTHGIDPHQLMPDSDGSLLVANGGVPTLPETGRAKLERSRMDPSLVRLHALKGDLLGQWRLPDPRLSIRHLARHASGMVGISLQSEHDDATARGNAPLLALFDGHVLRTAPQVPQALAGYGGDIAATRAGFAIGATRADALTQWNSEGEWTGATALAEACPLALLGDDELWAGGRTLALQRADSPKPEPHAVNALRLDNHWVAWAPAPV